MVFIDKNKAHTNQFFKRFTCWTYTKLSINDEPHTLTYLSSIRYKKMHNHCHKKSLIQLFPHFHFSGICRSTKIKMNEGQRSTAHDFDISVYYRRHRISKTVRHCTKIEALAIIQAIAKNYRLPRYIERKKKNQQHTHKHSAQKRIGNASIHTELKRCEEIKWNEKNTTFYQPTLFL